MRKFIVTVNGKSYEVEVEELGLSGNKTSSDTTSTTAQPSKSASANFAKSSSTSAPKAASTPKPSATSIPEGAEIVKAPMPGTILDIKVKPGDQVAKGQPLLILEAMKMENEIVSPRDAKVVSVQVATGSSVNAGDALVAIE